MMHGISDYRVYSARVRLYEELDIYKFLRNVFVGDFVSIEYFTDGFFHIKFHGVCISKTFCGFGSSFVLSDKLSLQQRFFVFSPFLKRVTIFSRRFKRVYM